MLPRRRLARCLCKAWPLLKKTHKTNPCAAQTTYTYKPEPEAVDMRPDERQRLRKGSVVWGCIQRVVMITMQHEHVPYSVHIRQQQQQQQLLSPQPRHYSLIPSTAPTSPSPHTQIPNDMGISFSLSSLTSSMLARESQENPNSNPKPNPLQP